MDAILLDERDNVATALRALPAGAVAQIGGAGTRALRVVEPIPLLHKIALVELDVGALVIKYDEVIGAMTHDARPPAASCTSTTCAAGARNGRPSRLAGPEIAPGHRPGAIENGDRI